MRLFLSVALLVGACTSPTTGNGHSQTQSRPVGNFTRVLNKSVLAVTVTPGPTSVAVTADSNLLPLITTTVTDGQLVIDQTQQNLTSSLTLSAAVTTPTLTAVDDVGAGSLTATGFNAGPFAIRSVGAGSLSFEGSVGSLTLESVGAPKTVLRGMATGLQAKITGAGNVDGSALRVAGPANVTLIGAPKATLVVQGDSTFDVQGGSALTLSLDGGTTSFKVSGAGTVLWSGQTALGQVVVSGAGSVKHQ